MTKSEMFKAAHKLAKTFTGDYRACFVMALAVVREDNATVADKRVNGFSNFLFRGNQPKFVYEPAVMVTVDTTQSMISNDRDWN